MPEPRPPESPALLLMERALDTQGLRHTVPRRTMLEVLAGMDHPFTSAELTEQVARTDPSIGRASVFRLLQLLRRCGLVERLHGPEAELYTLCLMTGHHHHVTCSVCGHTDVFTLEDAEAIARAVERIGYRMEHHVLQVFGVCGACQEHAGGQVEGESSE